MKTKKAQGLSLNFIIVAAIAALVLVLVISFTTGGLGTFFSKIFSGGEKATEDSDVDIAKSKCEALCTDAQSLDDAADWAGTDYCDETFVFEGTQANCYDSPINVDCSVTYQDLYGVAATCDQSVCGGCTGAACDASGVTIDADNCETCGGEWTDAVVDDPATADEDETAEASCSVDTCAPAGYDDCIEAGGDWTQ